MHGPFRRTPISTCLEFSLNITDTAYSYGYEPFSVTPLVVQSGMVLSYFQYGTYGCLDGTFEGNVFRHTLYDQNGVVLHPSQRYNQALTGWYRRFASMDPIVGKTVSNWIIAIDGSYPSVGEYTIRIKDVFVLNANGTLNTKILDSSTSPITGLNTSGCYYRTATGTNKRVSTIRAPHV